MMMDPCSLMDTMFLALRCCATTDTYAVIEVPLNPTIPEGEIAVLDDQEGYTMAGYSIRIVWDGSCNGNRISFEFRWEREQMKVAARPSSLTHLMSGKTTFQLEPITTLEAENAMMLGGIDYIRVMEMRTIAASVPVKFECQYVGKMDPEIGEIPVLESLKEPEPFVKPVALPVLERDGERVYLIQDGNIEATFEEVKPLLPSSFDEFEDDLPF